MVAHSNSKVSIIIPLFNQKEFVAQAIESSLNQSYANIEVILVNDGSTDNPLPLIKKYEKKIIYIAQDNKGLAGARNSGIKASTGDYIQLLDADDFLHPEKVRLQLEFSEKKKSQLSYCEIEQYEESSGRTFLHYVGKSEDLFSAYYNFWNVYPTPVHSLLIKKELFDRYGLFDEELKACEDRYFFSMLAADDISFDYFPFIGGARRVHDKNMNKNRAHIYENTINYYRKINKALPGNYIENKYGYSGERMMCANMTALLLGDIANGTDSREIGKIKALLKREGIGFDTHPLPGSKKSPLYQRLAYAYIKRWLSGMAG